MSDKPIEEAALNEQHTEQLTQQESVALPVLPGTQLAEKRMELNWTIEDVASRLNLAPRQILAIESDNYTALPGMAITRGFIRSYAKLLNLDAGPLLEQLSAEASGPKEDSTIRRPLPDKPFYDNRSPFAVKRSSGMKYKIVIGSMIALAVILVGWKIEWVSDTLSAVFKAQLPFGTASEESKASSESTLPSNMAGNEANMPVGPLAGQQDEQDSTARPAFATNQYIAPNNKEASTSAKHITANPHSLSGNEASIGSGKDRFVLTMREESWIEVRDSNRKVLISRLAKAGETESLVVTTPLDVKIGNAAGVDARLRGEPVELMPVAQGNVARLTVK